jgi:hypothetical protein
VSGNLLKLERVLQLNSHQLEEGHVTVSLQYKEEKGDGTAAALTAAAAVGDNDEEKEEEEEDDEEVEGGVEVPFKNRVIVIDNAAAEKEGANYAQQEQQLHQAPFYPDFAEAVWLKQSDLFHPMPDANPYLGRVIGDDADSDDLRVQNEQTGGAIRATDDVENPSSSEGPSNPSISKASGESSNSGSGDDDDDDDDSSVAAKKRKPPPKRKKGELSRANKKR